MKPISPWYAIVKSAIDKEDFIFQKKRSAYTFQAYNAADSFWFVVEWPNKTRIAFRCAFALINDFELNELTENENSFVIHLKTELGKYKVNIELIKSEEMMFHYTTVFTPARSMVLPFSPRDIVPLVQDGLVENTNGKIYAHQVGSRSGQLFFSMTKPKGGSVFYFQNLTALNEYCSITETSAAETVGGEWPEMGFRLPETLQKPIPQGKELVISDAYVVVSEEIPENENEISRHFLNYLAVVYSVIPKPEIEYLDWKEIAEKGLRDLTNNKGCWVHHAGKSYLNAYVSDYKTPPESMVQLAVLLPLIEYAGWLEEKLPVVDELIAVLPDFYEKKLHTISRWLPDLTDQLDQSEEHKREDVMDSWYLHHPLINLARLARKGNKSAEKLVLDSIDFVIDVAHRFKYHWPVFYKLDTLEVLKKETEPGKGGEKDVPGSYSHLMIELWELTGDKRFLNEAVKAAKQLEDFGINLLYQANNTAFSAGALLRLYKETGDELYLNLSYNCIAAILKNVQLWECEYGAGIHFPSFFGIFPLKDAPYTAAYEEFEVYAAIHDYLSEAEEIAILPAVRLLLAELIKYAVHRLPYYYPPLLPQDILSEEVRTGEVNPDLWIPLEDLYDGWEKNGQVGQEVYGAGLAFGILPRQYFKIANTGITIFINYPIQKLRKYKNTLTIKVKGAAELNCDLKIISDNPNLKIGVTEISADKHILLKPINGTEKKDYKVSGNSTLKIEW